MKYASGPPLKPPESFPVGAARGYPGKLFLNAPLKPYLSPPLWGAARRLPGRALPERAAGVSAAAYRARAAQRRAVPAPQLCRVRMPRSMACSAARRAALACAPAELRPPCMRRTSAGPAPRAPSQATRAQNLSCVQHAVAEAAADWVVERRRAGRVMGWSLFYYFLSMVSSPPQGGGPRTFALQRTRLCLPPLWSTSARAPLFTMGLRVAALNVVRATALEHTCQGILRATARGRAERA